jgi:hypothetical protein
MKIRKYRCDIMSHVPIPPEVKASLPEEWWDSVKRFGEPVISSSTRHLTRRGAKKFGDMVLANVPLSDRQYIYYEIHER